ncbi:hypothetical protein Emin_0110 [Elusimicrobium minutum Pei191]|uniref:Cell surface protein SprA n=1 Tax=Elusimicrobium minutum (strain Pei191) TaxID=445932 RepID=B2KAY0_ELUMP|nr:hypothetical protein [Elusimicrobium minutum]ACC97676.1 hypothetical protein Emin_0110 [Elusimicrobium minutum Pei191]
MKKIISLTLSLLLLTQSLPLFGNEYGLSILGDEDYTILALPEDSFPAAPEELSNVELMDYSEQFWRDAVRSIDGDNPLDKDVPPPITSLRPSFAIPLQGTSISLTGRQTLGIKSEAKNYKNENKNSTDSKSFSSFAFEQQMQVKMQGRIVDRIFVDINYDNQNEDTRDIFVSYRGKEGELVQSAEFGDVQLSLPKTEFISFNKQLFGAKMHLQHDKANLRLIGSKTKGTSRSKQFRGTSVFETVTIRDIDYIRRTYYNVREMLDSSDPGASFFTYQIARNSEFIYLNDGSSSSQFRFETLSYSDTADPLIISSGKFRLLERGVDYTIDYNNSLIVFRNSLAESDSVVIDYTNTAGQRLFDIGAASTYKLLKAAYDKPIAPGRASTYTEVKTMYNIGRKQITRDDGNGNFTLVLQDANGNNISKQEGQIYPQDIEVDFEKGTFKLNRRLNEASVYNNTPLSTRNLSFRVELNSKVKSYFVEPNIVVQSETVKVNGRTLKRNEDYYIDYSSGFLTFYKEGTVTEDSTIDVTYDTTGGSSSDVSLLGARLDYDFTENIGVGATVLQEGSSTSNSAPNINSLTQQLTVYEADIKAKDVQVTEDLKISASGEVAQSVREKNLFGYALIDNMDDAKQMVAGSVIFRDWKIASNPGFETSTGQNSYWGAVHWDTQSINALQINPNSASSSSDSQDVLVIDYDFTNSDEVSIVYPLSDSGVDLSEKTMFELTALGNSSGPLINVHFDQINEISDSSLGDNTITCSKYWPDYVPKTEDLYCRGSVSPENDRGWLFVNPDNTTARYDPFANNEFNRFSQPNGIVDTQDLDNNGRLDTGNPNIGGSFGYPASAAINQPIAGMAGSILNNTTWETFTTPLNLTSLTKDNWTNIKHLRISLKYNGGSRTGRIKIANVGVSGNAWTPDSETSQITAINKTDNTNYLPIFDDAAGDGKQVFNYLYGSLDELRSESRNKNIFEQALAFYYDTVTYQEIHASRNFSSMDMTTHKELRFLLHVKDSDPDSVFFMRLGTDQNYQQINVPLDLAPNKWHLIKLKLTDKDNNGIPEILEPITPNVTVDTVNDPLSPANVNFKKISRVLAGVERKTGMPGSPSGEVWLNEIHMANSVTSKGLAYRTDMKVELNGWGEAGGTYKSIDDQFETPVTVNTNQKNTTQDYYLRLTKVNYLPISATYEQSRVETLTISDSVNTNTITSLDQGVVEKKTGKIKADFIKPQMPRLGMEYIFDRADYDMAERNDARNTYNATVNHTLPSGSFLRDLSLGYTSANNDINYSDRLLNSASNTSYNSSEDTRRVNARLSFEPWKGSSFTPSYSLTTVKEDRDGGGAPAISYNKSMQQQAGFTGNFRITKWLMPAVSYNISTNETNNLNEITFSNGDAYGVGELKNINRSADGGVALTLTVKEIFPKAKLFGNLVLSNSYKLQDADSYMYVEDGYDSKSDLWIRNNLGAKNKHAFRRNMTLRDTFTSSQRWSPFREYEFTENLLPLKTLSIINNFTQSFQTTEETGTESKSSSRTLPDSVITMSELEKLYGGTYWLTSTNIKMRYTHIQNEIFNTQLKKENNYGLELRFMFIKIFDTALIYSHRDGDTNDLRNNEISEKILRDEYSAQTSFFVKRFRLTPKLAFIESKNQQRMGIVTEQYEEFSPSLNCRLDFSVPGGIWLPFINRNYATTNRIIWNTNFAYTQRRSDVVVLENKNYYDFNTSFDYEFSKNLRLTVNGGVQLLDHLYVESESYVGYNIGTMVTLQF